MKKTENCKSKKEFEKKLKVDLDFKNPKIDKESKARLDKEPTIIDKRNDMTK